MDLKFSFLLFLPYNVASDSPESSALTLILLSFFAIVPLQCSELGGGDGQNDRKCVITTSLTTTTNRGRKKKETSQTA